MTEKQRYSSTFSLPWRLCHHHAPAIFGFGIQSPWWPMAVCMERDDLPEAGHCLGHPGFSHHHTNPNNGSPHEKNTACKVCRLPSEPAEDTGERELQQSWLDSPCQLLEWPGPAPAAHSMPRQEWLTAQHHGDPGHVRGLGPSNRYLSGGEYDLRNTMPGHVMPQHASSSDSFPPRTQDVTSIWRSVGGRAMYSPPCRGSLSITRASYAPPETESSTMLNSSAYSDACSHWSTMTLPRRPGPPSGCPSESRTPWPSFGHVNRT